LVFVDLVGLAGGIVVVVVADWLDVDVSDTVADRSTGFVNTIFGNPADARLLVTFAIVDWDTSAGTAT